MGKKIRRKEIESMQEMYNYKLSNERRKKFVRYKEGAEMYSMGLTKFQELAKQSGSIYKINKMVLVNVEVLDEYLKRFSQSGIEVQ